MDGLILSLDSGFESLEASFFFPQYARQRVTLPYALYGRNIEGQVMHAKFSNWAFPSYGPE